MLCTFLVFYFCAASHDVIKNDNAIVESGHSVQGSDGRQHNATAGQTTREKGHQEQRANHPGRVSTASRWRGEVTWLGRQRQGRRQTAVVVRWSTIVRSHRRHNYWQVSICLLFAAERCNSCCHAGTLTRPRRPRPQTLAKADNATACFRLMPVFIFIFAVFGIL